MCEQCDDDGVLADNRRRLAEATIIPLDDILERQALVASMLPSIKQEISEIANHDWVDLETLEMRYIIQYWGPILEIDWEVLIRLFGDAVTDQDVFLETSAKAQRLFGVHQILIHGWIRYAVRAAVLADAIQTRKELDADV